jgi:glycosyltransferase involved in cell wall biosynthesis
MNDLELIVVDDGSVDESIATLAQLAKQDSRVRLFSRANKGAPTTINEGIARARGKWIGILNSDDLYAVNRLQLMLEVLERTDASWGFSRVEVIDGSGHRAQSARADWYRDLQAEIQGWPTTGYALLKANVAISTGNLFFARRLFELVGSFRELELVHDWDFALRLLYHAEPVYVDQPLYCYRLHDQNTIGRIAQTTTDREVAFILRDFFLAVALDKPPNTLAPNAYTWPGYFEETVRRLDFQGRPYRSYLPSKQEWSFQVARAAAVTASPQA